MLLITQDLEYICYSELMRVYEQSNIKHGASKYSRFSSAEQLLSAEQDLYDYLKFVLVSGGWFAAWITSDGYKSALRLEPFKDGYLITALETAQDDRGRGYADALLHNVVSKFSTVKVYAHIYSNNQISIHLHVKNGFVRIKNYAEFIDGSVTTDAYTYMLAV